MEHKALRRLLDWAHGDPDWVRRDPFGRFSAASAGKRPPADRLRGSRQERAVLERILSEGAQAFTVDLPGGYRAKAHTSHPGWGGRSVYISGTIVDGDGGSLAGDFTRVVGYADPDPDEDFAGSFNPDGSVALEAHHSSAVLHREHRTKGLLSVLNEAAAMWYDSLGVDQISVNAVDIGGYAWARHGFDWDRSSDNPGGTVPVKLRIARDKLTKTGGWEWGITDPAVANKVIADLDIVIADATSGFHTFTPRDVAMLGYEDARWTETIKGQEVEMWPGKAVMLDSYWNGLDRNYQENAARAAQLALARTETSPDGFSYDPVTGRHPTDGYMVSLRGLSQRFRFDGDRTALARSVSAYIDAHADIFEDPDIFVGGWLDTEHGEFVLDPAQRVADRAEAVRLGIERNQQSIWDVVGGVEIPTGGDGDR